MSSVEDAKTYVIEKKLSERLTAAVNAAIADRGAKPLAFIVRRSQELRRRQTPPH